MGSKPAQKNVGPLCNDLLRAPILQHKMNHLTNYTVNYLLYSKSVVLFGVKLFVFNILNKMYFTLFYSFSVLTDLHSLYYIKIYFL